MQWSIHDRNHIWVQQSAQPPEGPQHRVNKGGGDTGRQASLPGQVEEAVGKRQPRSLEML